METDTEPPDKEVYRTLKTSYKSIIKDNNMTLKIENALIRTNQIITHTYQFIKLYSIYCFDNNKELPLINQTFIKKVFNCVSIGDNRGRKIQYNNDELKQFSKLHFNYQTSRKNLSAILDYASKSMQNAYKNFIMTNFIPFLSRFIKNMIYEEYRFIIIELENKNKKKELKKLYKELNKDAFELKNIIINDNEIIEKYYWFKDKYLHQIIPKINDKSHYYYLKAKPFMYLKCLFFMNFEIEKTERKLFQMLPLRTDIIPKYIDIDTKVLIEVSDLKDKNKYYCDIETYKKEIWNTFFNMNNKVFRDKNGYCFNYTIQTDLIGCSILFYKKVDKILKKDDFLYLDDFKKEKIRDLKQDYNFIYTDPGKSQLLYMMDDNENFMKYTNKRRCFETQRIKYQKILERMKKQFDIKKIEKDLSLVNSKTTNFIKFKEYIKVKNEINEKLFNFYVKDLKHRKFKLRKQINKQRSEQKLITEIKNKFTIDNKKPLFIYGSWNITKQQRNFISTPNIGIKRLINNNFKLLTLDEFRTSCLEYRTEERIKNKRDDKTNKLIHSVLILTENNKDIGCINRDKNAVLNYKKITDYYIETGKRLERFKRGIEI